MNPNSYGYGKVFEGLKPYDIETGDISSAYLMPPSISGKKFFCFTNKEKTMAARAEHKVPPLDTKSPRNRGILTIDFQLRSHEAVMNALAHHRSNHVSLEIPSQTKQKK